MLGFREVIKWNVKAGDVLRELKPGESSTARFWEEAAGDPEKHISYCIQAVPACLPVQVFLQHHCKYLLRGI